MHDGLVVIILIAIGNTLISIYLVILCLNIFNNEANLVYGAFEVKL